MTSGIPSVARSRYDYVPWLFKEEATDAERASHAERIEALVNRTDAEVHESVFIAESAAVYPRKLEVGADSYIAGHVFLDGNVTMGRHCTLNPYVMLRGRVSMGEGVRVGAHTSILGFNHSMAPELPIYEQEITVQGITIGNDVWIGSHVVVLDGVNIGSHAVVGAGSIVTKDVAEWSVVAGNPARCIRDRRSRSNPPHHAGDSAAGESLALFADAARRECVAILDRCWVGSPGAGHFVDRPSAAKSVRAQSDSVEISDLLLGSAPPQIGSQDLVRMLQAFQDKRTGLVPDLPKKRILSLDDRPACYNMLSVGYALRLLGASFLHPINIIEETTAGVLLSELDRLPWNSRAWACGSWVDEFATGIYHNAEMFNRRGPIETLVGWLTINVDRWTGVWGSPDVQDGWHQAVNGFYRASRGTFAQFGLPLPYPERTVDTVLQHKENSAYFSDARITACDVLDVIHPLWLAAKQTSHRRTEAEAWARDILARVLGNWRHNEGFAFALFPGDGPEHTASLKGTEMWLSIVWLLADYVGDSDLLKYRPRGVHRPDSAIVP